MKHKTIKNYALRIPNLIIALSLTLLASCGGGNDGGNNPTPPTPVVSLSVTPQVNARVGEPKTVNVTRTNTPDFTLSAVNGAGCVRSSANAIVCTPTATGDHSVTLTATADTSKTALLTVRVPDVVEIDSEDEIELYADDAESGEIIFNAASGWTASVTEGAGATPTWIRLKTASGHETTITGGAGTNYIAVELDPNYTKATRTAVITISLANGYQKTITVTQLPTTEDGIVLLDDTVTINISPSDAGDIGLFSAVSFAVTVLPAGNTGFTWTVLPESGAGCVKTGNILACTPKAAKAYTVTVTADANTTKTKSAAFTAVKPETLNIALTGTPGIEMVHVEATTSKESGTFEMGCTTYRPEGTWSDVIKGFEGEMPGTKSANNCSPTARPRHTVKLTKDFYIGKYEVTQEEWEALMPSNPSPDENKNNKRNPVTNVSWRNDDTHLDVYTFINKLNERDAGKGWEWRLPTEAEWEYAAGGGHKESNCMPTAYVCLRNGSQSGSAWGTIGSSGTDSIHPVDEHPYIPISAVEYSTERFPGNELGLYNMVGNAAEWVQDIYGAYSPTGPGEYQTDPSGPGSTGENPDRVVRGGSYISTPKMFDRISGYSPAPQNLASKEIGFRLVLSLTESEP